MNKKKLRKLLRKLKNQQAASDDSGEVEELHIEVIPSRETDPADWPGGKKEVEGEGDDGLTIITEWPEAEEVFDDD